MPACLPVLLPLGVKSGRAEILIERACVACLGPVPQPIIGPSRWRCVSLMVPDIGEPVQSANGPMGPCGLPPVRLNGFAALCCNWTHWAMPCFAQLWLSPPDGVVAWLFLVRSAFFF